VQVFHNDFYRRINARRLEHLAALGLPLSGRTVLQVGAGIGDHAEFFIDRGCTVTVTEGRADNLEVLRKLRPELRAFRLDLDDPDPAFTERFEVVFCYGALYHLARPAQAIAYMADRCTEFLLVESCVSMGAEPSLPQVAELAMPDQALAGIGSRPTRSWIRRELERHFEFVYLSVAQPAHPQFPTDWTSEPSEPLTRAVFVAARKPLDSPLLTVSIPDRQAHI
jgi:hypothetical protein